MSHTPAKPMADPPEASDKLLDRLLARGCTFDFFQAVWLLERFGDVQVPVGERGPVADESFRFRPDVSLGFPATDVRSITRCTDATTHTSFHRIEVAFLGLYGSCTPLPLHYAVDILRSVEQSGPGLANETKDQVPGAPSRQDQDPGGSPTRDFLDIFHHRLVSLFYRSWLKYRYDKTFGMADRDAISDYLLWLIGCPRAYDQSVLGVSPIRLLRYAGVLTQHPRSAPTLEGVLEDYWDELSITIQQCVGRWVAVGMEDRNKIGNSNTSLGVDLTVGEEVYDLSGAFNVTVGPMDWATYLSFLPDGPRFSETRALIDLYNIDPLWFTLEPHLSAGEVPELRLASDDSAARLGFTSWARTGELGETSVAFDAASAAVWRARIGQGAEEPARSGAA